MEENFVYAFGPSLPIQSLAWVQAVVTSFMSYWPTESKECE
jgi:hypothetical protein